MGSSLHRALICVLGSCLLGGCAGVPRTIESYRLPTRRAASSWSWTALAGIRLPRAQSPPP